MPLTNNFYHPRILEQEDVVAKINLVEILERASPYRHRGKWGNSTYHERIEKLVNTGVIPEEHRPSALALFANVVYLSESILDGVWLFQCEEPRKKAAARLAGRGIVRDAAVAGYFEDGSLRTAADREGLEIAIWRRYHELRRRSRRDILRRGFLSRSFLLFYEI